MTSIPTDEGAAGQPEIAHLGGGTQPMLRVHSNEAAPVHEAWWLIEAVAPPRPLYFAGLRRATEAKRPHQAVTTEDASGAVRYPTEDTAKLAVAQMIGADTSNHLWPLLVANSAWKVAEHIFDYTPPAAPAQLLNRPPMPDVECWERGLPDSIDRAMAQEAKEVADLLAMTEPEIDAELRQHGIDPAEAAAMGAKAVKDALAAAADEATTEQCIELAGALEQLRAIKIAEAVHDLPVGGKEALMPTAFQAGYCAACEEIIYRLRTEEWANCLPPVDAAKATGAA